MSIAKASETAARGAFQDTHQSGLENDPITWGTSQLRHKHGVHVFVNV